LDILFRFMMAPSSCTSMKSVPLVYATAVPQNHPTTIAAAGYQATTTTMTAIQQQKPPYGSFTNNNNKNNMIHRHERTAAVAAKAGRTTLTCDMGNDAKQIQILTEQGYTIGLAKSVLGDAKQAFVKRMWIVDNSGSMQHNDGSRMMKTRQRGDVRLVRCSRWEEIQECVKYHVELAAAVQAPTSFRLLNDPGPGIGPENLV